MLFLVLAFLIVLTKDHRSSSFHVIAVLSSVKSLMSAMLLSMLSEYLCYGGPKLESHVAGKKNLCLSEEGFMPVDPGNRVKPRFSPWYSFTVCYSYCSHSSLTGCV